MRQKTNESFLFETFDTFLPPFLQPLHYGEGSPHVPDILVIDMGDDKDEFTVPKADYVISGTKLFLHEKSSDPWNLTEVFENFFDVDAYHIKDSVTKLSKRACGAKRVDSKSGPLVGDDRRTVSMSLRYWVSYPEAGLDLTNEDHVCGINEMILKQKSLLGKVETATFEAKTDDACQYVGPNIAAEKTSQGIVFTVRSTADCNPEEIEKFLNSDPAVQEAVSVYMDTIGIDKSPFTVTPKNESLYNSVELNLPLATNFALGGTMLARPVKIKFS